jgi:hypothetical protein
VISCQPGRAGESLSSHRPGYDWRLPYQAHAPGRRLRQPGFISPDRANSGLSAAHPVKGQVASPAVTGPTRELYGFELEPEVRDWLDSLSDSDYKRVDEVCGLLAEKGTELGGPWSDHLDGPVWELRVRLRDVAARVTY